MKVAVALLALVAVACAAPHPQKRVWFPEVFHSVGDFFTHAYNEAKDAVVGVVNSVGDVLCESIHIYHW